MRWPWVSRAAHDDAVARAAALERVNVQLLEDLRAERARYEQLVLASLTMRREGFDVTTVPVPQKAPEDPLEPIVRSAIERRTDPRSPARRKMIEQALALKEAGVDAKDVAEMVLVGDTDIPL